jgi:hypothetical protein
MSSYSPASRALTNNASDRTDAAASPAAHARQSVICEGSKVVKAETTGTAVAITAPTHRVFRFID